MVFCYKTITETPVSPSRRSSARKLDNASTSFSQLMRTIDYENISVIESIPDREWKLLSALAKKREDDMERERLVDQFHRMWQKEREDREMIEAATNNHYNTYIHRKRQQERSQYEHQRRQRAVEQQLRRVDLLQSIRSKEARWRDHLANMDDIKFRRCWLEVATQSIRSMEARWRDHLANMDDMKVLTYIHRKQQHERSQYEHQRRQRAVEQQLRRGELIQSIHHLANVDNMKASQILNKAIDGQVKAIKAAGRRSHQMTVEELRRRAELQAAKSKEKEAWTRRNARLRDAAQRLAISNELSTWESIMHRQEVEALDAAKRANHAAHAALTSERSDCIARERHEKKARARRIAQHTWQMREDLKAGKYILNTNRTY